MIGLEIINEHLLGAVPPFDVVLSLVGGLCSAAIMTVLLSHHSGPVVVSAASNSHRGDFLALEKIHFKVLHI